jgi:hypothetical protein
VPHSLQVKSVCGSRSLKRTTLYWRRGRSSRLDHLQLTCLVCSHGPYDMRAAPRSPPLARGGGPAAILRAGGRLGPRPRLDRRRRPMAAARRPYCGLADDSDPVSASIAAAGPRRGPAAMLRAGRRLGPRPRLDCRRRPMVAAPHPLPHCGSPTAHIPAQPDPMTSKSESMSFTSSADLSTGVYWAFQYVLIDSSITSYSRCKCNTRTFSYCFINIWSHIYHEIISIIEIIAIILS